MATTIAITNQKGGVGKTTTAVNLGAGLAYTGYRVLILDFDPQGHSSEHLGVKVISDPTSQKTALELIQMQKDPASCVYPSHINNLWVIPSNLQLGIFNQNSPTGRQFNLKNSLEGYIQQNFDFVVIDCQPSLSLLTLNALTACDLVLLPVQAEFLALDGLSQLVVTLKEIQTKLHPKLKVLGILLTMFDKRNRLSGEVKNELEKNFQNDLFKTVIPRTVKLAESPSFGKSIFEYDPNSSGAEAYKLLVEEVLTRLER